MQADYDRWVVVVSVPANVGTLMPDDEIEGRAVGWGGMRFFELLLGGLIDREPDLSPQN